MSFVIGSLVLFDTEKLGSGIPKEFLLGVALVAGTSIIFTVIMAVKARQRRVVSGSEEMIGATGAVVENFDRNGKGQIFIHSELWQATCDQSLRKGDKVSVIKREGLTLTVRSKSF